MAQRKKRILKIKIILFQPAQGSNYLKIKTLKSNLPKLHIKLIEP